MSVVPLPVRDLIKGADMILTTAEADGIPMPVTVAVSFGSLSIQLASPDHVAAWAKWRGLTVQPTAGTGLADRFVRTHGEMYDVPFAAYAIAPIREPVCFCQHLASQHSAIGCGANTGMGGVCRCVKSSGAVARDALKAPAASQ